MGLLTETESCHLMTLAQTMNTQRLLVLLAEKLNHCM